MRVCSLRAHNAELLSKMYAEADEEGKASLSQAWETGRKKREGKE